MYIYPLYTRPDDTLLYICIYIYIYIYTEGEREKQIRYYSRKPFIINMLYVCTSPIEGNPLL